jgi:UDP-N-acetylmuramate--alanine ligase
VNLKDIHRVYFIGIGGIGMSALARYFLSQNKSVSGYDKTETLLTMDLIKEGIPVHYNDNINLIPEQFKDKSDTLVVITPAVPSNHSEVVWFRTNGFEIKKRAEVLGMISLSGEVIGIAGTHGKTTTSTMVAHLLRHSGHGCNAFLGGISINYNTNFLISENSNYLVVEADEYDRSFLQLKPKASIVTSMDADHLDIYKSYGEYCKAFYQYISQIQPGGFLVIKKGLEPLDNHSGIKVFTYSLNEESDFYSKNISVFDGYYQFDIVTPIGVFENIKMGFPGLLNVENAIAAIAMASLLNIRTDDIRDAMKTFRGVKRRFEYYINTPELKFIDDYGHHPEELRYTIQSVKELFPGKKITGIFPPHLYTRTRDFADEFAKSLSMLDELILLEIYPARELPIPGVSSEALLEKVAITKKHFCLKKNLIKFLDSLALPEILITMGAGDIDTMVEPIRDLLLKRMDMKK